MRLSVYSHADEFLFDLAEADVFECVRTEEVNGEHSLSVTTTQRLDQGMRVLSKDAAGTWREYVVTAPDELHDGGRHAIGTYYCTWSLQHDLSTVYGQERRPGLSGNPVVCGVALEAALADTKRWTVGRCDVQGAGGVSMYNNSAWERVSDVVAEYGGELDARITVDGSKVSRREVMLYTAQGATKATRRFDWGRDTASVRRKPPEGARVCRVKFLGKGEQSGEGYGRKITIADANGGVDYLRDAQAEAAFRLPDGSGGWEYPTAVVENGDIDDPAELKAWGQEHLHDYTRPVPTYEASVLQYAEAGADMQGVGLGDPVHIVDRGFNPGAPLRIEARVVKVVTNELDPSDVRLTVGQLGASLSDYFKALDARMGAVQSQLDAMWQQSGGTDPTTAQYLDWLMQQMADRINASGGYVYQVPGYGIRTYDKEVSDPAVGAEADKVVALTGGGIMFANSRTSSGDWDWKTLIEAGHIATDLVTGGRITTGFIGSPSGNYWNLDTGELRMAATTPFVDAEGNQVSIVDINALANDAAYTALLAEQRVTGGEQLLRGTNTATELAASGSWEAAAWRAASGGKGTRARTDIAGAPANGVTRGWRLARTSGALDVAQDGVPMAAGQNYTLSCYAKGSGKLRIQAGADPWLLMEFDATDGWRRYALTFKAGQGDASVKDGRSNCYFGCSEGEVEVCGLKLERGDAATDWSAHKLDVEADSAAKAQDALGKAQADAEQKARKAVAESNRYTDEITKADREFTEQQVKALDASMTQAKVFDRLTGGGRQQGIFLDKGLLYLNATYMKTGVLDAGVVKAGVLASKSAWDYYASHGKSFGENTYWNMATGYLQTKNAVMVNAKVTGQFTTGTNAKLEFRDGQLRGYQGSTRVGYIDATASSLDKDKGVVRKGIQIQGGLLRIHTTKLAVAASSDVKKDGTYGFNGTRKWNVVSRIQDMGNGSIRWWTTEHGIKCINGIVVSAW